MASSVSNTHIYDQDWSEVLQAQLDEPTKWKDVCDVVFVDRQVFNNPYDTDPTAQTLNKNTPYTYQPITQTNETVTIAQRFNVPQLIDFADLAESSYARLMYQAERQGVVLNERIETSFLADHAEWTNFGVGDITAGTVADTTQITPSANNVDDIVRHVRRVIRVANGESFLERNGGAFIWHPNELELLEGFLQANGYAIADNYLKEGVRQGINALGMTHYSSNLRAANHTFAGVKKLSHIYILGATYGKIVINDKDANATSGVSVSSRVDFEPTTWNNFTPVILDINTSN